MHKESEFHYFITREYSNENECKGERREERVEQ